MRIFFSASFEAHSESEIVVVLSGFIDEEVPGTRRLAVVPPGEPPPPAPHLTGRQTPEPARIAL